jgi:hypothetical protein
MPIITNMQPREETFALEKGKGLIEIRRQNYASGLFIKGKPIVFNWDEASGSICQEFYLVEHYSEEESVAKFRDLIENGFAPKQSLRSQLIPFLQNLSSGTYKLTLELLTESTWGEWEQGYTLSGYYPDTLMLLPTQYTDSLDEKRILEWAYAIENGANPIVITLTDEAEHWCEFILDGHHKLWGYSLAQVRPWRLRICGQSSKAKLRFTDLPEIRGDRPYGWKYAFDLAGTSQYKPI